MFFVLAPLFLGFVILLEGFRPSSKAEKIVNIFTAAICILAVIAAVMEEIPMLLLTAVDAVLWLFLALGVEFRLRPEPRTAR